MNNSADEPRSLLRRLLKKADGLEAPSVMPVLDVPLVAPTPEPTSTPVVAAPTSTKTPTGPLSPVAPIVTPPPNDAEVAPPPPPPKRLGTSPIRPPVPQNSLPTNDAQPIIPKPRSTQTVDAIPQINTVEERLQAEAALEKLREKTALVAAEFAEGKLNRAQFVAMYAHYNEKRTIIEKLLARDPGTSAWQSVAKPGHTTFLRAHFEARVLSYAIYEQSRNAGHLITSQGLPLVSEDLSAKIIAAITILKRSHSKLNAQRKEIGDGHWAVFVPGLFTTAIVVFSLEPSSRQSTLIQDLHRDFERANRRTLERNIFEPEQLVFPHRALFEKSTNKLNNP